MYIHNHCFIYIYIYIHMYMPSPVWCNTTALTSKPDSARRADAAASKAPTISMAASRRISKTAVRCHH